MMHNHIFYWKLIKVLALMTIKHILIHILSLI